MAYASHPPDAPGLEVRINFGVFAGREATPAELEELARALVPEVGEVSIVSEQRHEVGPQTEAALHQVRIELDAERVPADAEERESLSRRLVEEAVRWANGCIAERRVEIS